MTPAWLSDSIRSVDPKWAERALEHQAQLTKPPGSLGRLEEVAVRLSALQGRERPAADRVHVTVFAADHGVALEGVSAFPQEVTSQMLDNFVRGGAAISVMSRSMGASLEIVDVGTAAGGTDRPGVRNHRVGKGTANIRTQDAMSEAQLERALQAGREAAERASQAGCDLFIGGDMGIANTTSATALACALLSADPKTLAGPGTGLNPAGVMHKATVIKDALDRCMGAGGRPLEVLRCLGGFEIAALTGAFIRAAQLGLPVLVDGFITTAAALVAVRHDQSVGSWLLFSHQSSEPGHGEMLKALKSRPLLDLSLRLGEGSGAAAAVPLLRLACSLHNEMATFAEAGISEG